MRHKDNIFTIKEQPLQTRSKQYGKLQKKKTLELPVIWHNN